jgi:hypothetical protein
MLVLVLSHALLVTSDKLLLSKSHKLILKRGKSNEMVAKSSVILNFAILWFSDKFLMIKWAQ